MLPTRLEMRNFLAYRQPDAIEFHGIHLACLSGPNGAGKSSLLDAITWALWGKARTRSDDDLIHQGQSEMMVQLDFIQGESLYRVVRKRQKGKSAKQGRSTLDLFVWDAEFNQHQLISAPSIRETDARICDLLRLTYDTFVDSAFLQQGKADSFTIKPPGERKAILSKILGLEQWTGYEERAKDTLRQIEHEVGVIDMRLDEIAAQEAEEPALRRDLDVAQAAVAEAAAQREQAEAHYAEVAGAQEQMNAAHARLVQATHRIKQRRLDLADIEAEQQRTMEQLGHLRALIEDRESIEQGYAQLQAARHADQALGEKLQAMSAIKDRLNEANARIQAARSELEAQVKVHRDRIGSAERIAGEIETYQADLSDVQGEVAQLEADEARRDDLRETINTLNEEMAELKAFNHTLYDEMQAIKARIGAVQGAQAVCPTCGQPLSEGQKTSLLLDLQVDGTQRGDTHRANQTRLIEIADTIKAYRAEIEGIDVELRRLQPLRDRAAMLGQNVEAARNAGDTIQSESAALQAVETMLDAGDYARELQAQRDTIQAEIDALGYDSNAHNAARETLSTYHDYERRQRDLEAALKQVPDLQAVLDNAAVRRERWQAALAEEEKEAGDAQTEMDALAELVEEARRREDEVRRLRTAEKRANEGLIRAQQALAALDAARRRKEELVQRQHDLLERKSIYEDLRSAFGKNGVPAMIIEAAIPELEESANHLLMRMSGGRMNVRLDTQREKKTGGTAETLDILIGDELGTRSYELYSGGEAFRVNFALRVALSQMLARRAGAQLRTLFLDEGFGTQDENGRQRLVEAITAVQDHFDLLLVITHIDDLRDAFPVQITVTKTPDGSRIVVG